MSLLARIMLMLIVCVVEMMTSFLFIPSESTASRCNNLLDVLVWCIWQGGLVCSFFFLSIRRQYCSTAVRMVVYLYSIVVFVLTGFSIAVCVLFSGILFFDADFRFIFSGICFLVIMVANMNFMSGTMRIGKIQRNGDMPRSLSSDQPCSLTRAGEEGESGEKVARAGGTDTCDMV